MPKFHRNRIRKRLRNYMRMQLAMQHLQGLHAFV